MFCFCFSLQNFLHRLPGPWPGTVWASAQQHAVPTEFRRLWWGCSRNAMFPGESGTLRPTVLPPRSLSSSDDPGFWLWAGQRTKQKKRERTPRPPAGWGSPWRPEGRWLWVTGLPLGWALLSSCGRSLRGHRRPAGGREWRGGGQEGPVVGPCHPHRHWPGRCLSGGAARGLVRSSPGRGDVLKREPNLGG